MKEEVESVPRRNQLASFQVRGFVIGVALALVASFYVPWLRPAQATITIILFAFVGVLGALVGGLICIVFSGHDTPTLTLNPEETDLRRGPPYD